MNKAKLLQSVLTVLLVLAILQPLLQYDIMPSFTTVKANPGWLSGWTYRKQHNITGTTINLTDYQMEFTLHWGSGEALIIAGGKPDQNSTGYIVEAWLLDTGEIISLEDLPVHANAGSATVYDNKLYCFGGHWANGSTQIFHASNWSWTLGDSMYESRQKLSRHIPNNGTEAHIFGGQYSGTRRKNHWIYTFATDTWSNSTWMNWTRSSPFIGYDNGNFHVVGGASDETGGNKVEWNSQWNATYDVWQNYTGHPFKLTDGFGIDFEGRLWTIAGWTHVGGSQQIKYVHSYNYTTDSWSAETYLPHTLAHHSGDVARGRIYICCGDYPAGSWQDQIYAYFPMNQSWVLLSDNEVTARGSPLVGILTLADHEGTVFLNNKSRTDFGDIRFTQSDGTTLLPYWIKEKVDGKKATFIVNLDISTSGETIYVYYGKSDATTTSNWDNTYPILSDNFEDTNQGEFPSGWNQTAGNPNDNATVETDKKAEGDKSFRLQEDGGDQACAVTTLDLNGYSDLICDFYWRISGASNDRGQIYLQNQTGRNVGGLLLKVGYQPKYYHSGGIDDVPNAPTISSGTWYHIRIYARSNDTQLKYRFDTSDSGWLNNKYEWVKIDFFKFKTHNTYPAQVWLDFIFMTNYYDPPPENDGWGIEETEPSGDSTYPTYSGQGHNTTVAGNPVQFHCQWQDETALSHWRFGTNNTGSWVNETWASFSGSPEWANVSKTLTASVGVVVQYQWWANDTSNNLNTTGTLQLTTSAGGAGDNTVALNAPSSGSKVDYVTVNFNYTPAFYSPIQNSSLWLNVTESWQRVGWNASKVQNGTLNTISYTFSTTATYIWNVQVFNTTHGIFAASNWTLTVNISPWYNYAGHNSTTQGQPCEFYSQWEDETALGWCIFGTNNTGSWVNETYSLEANPDWCNVTKTLYGAVGWRIEYQFWANDTDNNWNTTGLLFFTTTAFGSPTYSDIGYNTTIRNQPIEFSCKWTDPDGLSGFIFSWNGTGSWSNDTWAPLTGTEDWANVTSKTLPSGVGVNVGFRWYCNDTGGILGDTGIQSLTTIRRWYYFNFAFRDRDTNDVEGLITWELFNLSGSLGYIEGQPTLINGTYTLETYWHEYTISVRDDLDTDVYGNTTVTTDLEMELWMSGKYLGFNNTLASLSFQSTVPNNITFTVTETEPLGYVIILETSQNFTYVMRNGVNQSGWTYDSVEGIVTIAVADLSEWQFIKTSSPIYWLRFNFRDKDSYNVKSRIAWELWNSSHNLNYVEGQASLSSGTYTLKTSFYAHLINETSLPTATYGNTTVTINLEMKRHTTVTNGYVAFNNTITSITVDKQTATNLTFTVAGSTPALMIVTAAKNASYVQRAGVNQTGWMYVASPKHIHLNATTLSTWQFIFPGSGGDITPPSDVSEWVAIGIHYGYLGISIISITILIAVAVLLICRDMYLMTATIIIGVAVVVVLFTLLMVLNAFGGL